MSSLLISHLLLGTGILLVYPLCALSQQNLQNLGNGVYLFSSKLPDRSRHKDIQLAGAEIYVLQKNGRTVIGERFIANSSEANCFKGRIVGNIITGEGIFVSFPLNSEKPDRFELVANLEVFKLLPLNSLTYSKGSIQRCIEQFDRYRIK